MASRCIISPETFIQSSLLFDIFIYYNKNRYSILGYGCWRPGCLASIDVLGIPHTPTWLFSTGMIQIPFPLMCILNCSSIWLSDRFLAIIFSANVNDIYHSFSYGSSSVNGLWTRKQGVCVLSSTRGTWGNFCGL